MFGTLAHVLSDDVDGLLRHHGVELHQLVMPQFLHDLSLLQEGLGGHGPRLQSFHCHLGRAIPCTCQEHGRQAAMFRNSDSAATCRKNA